MLGGRGVQGQTQGHSLPNYGFYEHSPVCPQGLGPQHDLGNTVSRPMSATHGRVQRPLRCQCRLSPVVTLHSEGTTNAITSSLVRRECRERTGCANSLVHHPRQPPHPVGFLGRSREAGNRVTSGFLLHVMTP